MIEIDATTPPAAPERPVWPAMVRGLKHTCPACGQGGLYKSYLKVVDTCSTCGEELHHQRADDAPPYFTIFIVGHIVVGGILALEKALAPDTWVHLAVWLPLLVVMSLLLLPRIKGAVVGQQWAMRMHGFSGKDDEAPLIPEPASRG